MKETKVGNVQINMLWVQIWNIFVEGQYQIWNAEDYTAFEIKMNYVVSDRRTKTLHDITIYICLLIKLQTIVSNLIYDLNLISSWQVWHCFGCINANIKYCILWFDKGSWYILQIRCTTYIRTCQQKYHILEFFLVRILLPHVQYVNLS